MVYGYAQKKMIRFALWCPWARTWHDLAFLLKAFTKKKVCLTYPHVVSNYYIALTQSPIFVLFLVFRITRKNYQKKKKKKSRILHGGGGMHRGKKKHFTYNIFAKCMWAKPFCLPFAWALSSFEPFSSPLTNTIQWGRYLKNLLFLDHQLKWENQRAFQKGYQYNTMRALFKKSFIFRSPVKMRESTGLSERLRLHTNHGQCWGRLSSALSTIKKKKYVLISHILQR